MRNNELDSRYFDWMCQLVYDANTLNFGIDEYTRLFHHLDATPFTYEIPMDGNREVDGINLRYRFGSENQIDDRVIARYLDTTQCSVFEMMVALASRCEEQIMHDDELGDRTPNWFWEMIENLGLMGMTNDNYDQFEVEEILNCFLDRTYSRTGEGGLFYVEDPPRDMRDVEIWYQMCWYLNDLGPGSML